MNTNAKSQGMAVTSLVLGVLSPMCFGPLTGIPAIILGHVAYRRTRREPEIYSGSGFAITGFTLGYLSLLTTVLFFAAAAKTALPALARAKGQAQRIACMNNLKQIGLGVRVWSSTHDGKYPWNVGTNNVAKADGDAVGPDAVPYLRALRVEFVTPVILVCPGDPAKRPAVSFDALSRKNVSYQFETGPEVKESNPQEVLARCPIHGIELYCDGSVH